MNISRSEMEDIWNNKPYGYLKTLKKKFKGKKKYKVKLQPYAYKFYETYEVEVMARNISDSYAEARLVVMEKIEDKKSIDGWRYIHSSLA
jgi:hypothetical protein